MIKLVKRTTHISLKKKLVVSVLFIGFCLLQGCNESENIKVLSRSGLNVDSMTIRIDKKYTIKDYSKNETGSGCTVTINYTVINESE